jgi:signal transduction histidine kinase
VAERLCGGRSLEVRSSCQGRARKIPEATADAMFLVGLEAIANSIRHSGATRIDIDLVVHNELAELTVKDNGAGFLVDANNYGFGLRGMTRRAAGARAQLEITSEPGAGTRVQISAHIGRLSAFRRRSRQWLKQFSLSGIPSGT